MLVLSINGALRAFDTVYLMTRGGPGNSTQLFMTQVFQEGLVNNNFGYASAMAVLVLIVLIAIAAVQNRLNNTASPPRRATDDHQHQRRPAHHHAFRDARARRLPINLLLIVLSIAMIYPIVIIVITAFKPNLEVLTNPTGLPQAPTFDNFVTSWQDAGFANLFFNSVLLTVVSMTVATFVAALASYAIVRQATRIGSGVYLMLAAGIFLPMQLALVPQFRVVRDLGLINNYAGVILIYIAGALPFGVFLMAAFMRQVPKEIVEARSSTGRATSRSSAASSSPRPPAIATFWVLQGVGVWNDYSCPSCCSPTRRSAR